MNFLIGICLPSDTSYYAQCRNSMSSHDNVEQDRDDFRPKLIDSEILLIYSYNQGTCVHTFIVKYIVIPP